MTPPILAALLLLLAQLSAAFTPPDLHLLNCGSASAATVDGRVFTPDTADPAGSLPISIPAAHHPLYSTARVFTRPASYDLVVKSKGTHFLRLHFNPFVTPQFNSSAAAFTVKALDYLLMFEYNPTPSSLPFMKEFLINIPESVSESERVLKIVFTPTPLSCMPSSFAYINAIELFSAPPTLIWDIARLPGGGPRGKYVDGVAKQGLETVRRLNIGGPRLTPFNDTLWRSWDSDYTSLMPNPGAKIVSFSGRIQYQRGGSSREVAPDNIYRSALSLPAPAAADSKLEWVLPVDLGHKYLVRLHLCDIVSLAVNQLYFNVYINDMIGYADLDLSGVDFSNQLLASPYYVDFVVEPKQTGLSTGVIHVGVGPSNVSEVGNMNAILNGLELFKMNDSMGSFAPHVSDSGHGGKQDWDMSDSLCPVYISIGVLLCLLVWGVYAMVVKRREFMNGVGWSALPNSDDEKTGLP